MRSFVLWYEPREDTSSSEVNLDIHINLWKKKKPVETFVFDFGLMIDKIDLIKNIYFYLPFKESKWNDLGHIISANPKLVEAIFNENCNVSTFHPKRVKVKFKESDEEFVLYSLSQEDIRKESYSKGELLTLNVNSILDISEVQENDDIKNIKKYYFRFRFEISKDKVYLIKESDFNKNFFLDIFSRTETIDFRINDIRSCSEKVMEEYYRNKKFQIKKIHYLLLRNSNDEFLYLDGNVNSRVLEKELWSNYIENIPEDVIAYHIKEVPKVGRDKIKSFSKLVRFKYDKTSWIRIIIIILVNAYLKEIISLLIKLLKIVIVF